MFERVRRSLPYTTATASVFAEASRARITSIARRDGTTKTTNKNERRKQKKSGKPEVFYEFPRQSLRERASGSSHGGPSSCRTPFSPAYARLEARRYDGADFLLVSRFSFRELLACRCCFFFKKKEKKIKKKAAFVRATPFAKEKATGHETDTYTKESKRGTNAPGTH